MLRHLKKKLKAEQEIESFSSIPHCGRYSGCPKWRHHAGKRSGFLSLPIAGARPDSARAIQMFSVLTHLQRSVCLSVPWVGSKRGGGGGVARRTYYCSFNPPPFTLPNSTDPPQYTHPLPTRQPFCHHPCSPCNTYLFSSTFMNRMFIRDLTLWPVHSWCQKQQVQNTQYRIKGGVTCWQFWAFWPSETPWFMQVCWVRLCRRSTQRGKRFILLNTQA